MKAAEVVRLVVANQAESAKRKAERARQEDASCRHAIQCCAFMLSTRCCVTHSRFDCLQQVSDVLLMLL